MTASRWSRGIEAPGNGSECNMGYTNKDLFVLIFALSIITNTIYLYQRLKIDSYRDRLQNFKENAWNSIGWNAAEWWVK